MSEMPTHNWVFPAQLVRVVDGDTVDVSISQGMHAYRTERLRLLGVNAPEARGATKAAGDAATAFVVDWMGVAVGEWPLRIETHKSDVFGRYLALCFRVIDGRCLNEDLLSSGNAVVFVR
jgi:micrococcal nuclease